MGAKYTAEDIAKWFIAHNKYIMDYGDGEYLTPGKLQKLLYYAQGVYLAMKNEPLFNDDILACSESGIDQ